MHSWRNQSPGDLSITLDAVHASDINQAVIHAHDSAASWAKLPLDVRIAYLRTAQTQIDEIKNELAKGIALETGKPIKEATGEIGAVLAKFDLAISDAKRYLAEETVMDNAHPNLIRRRARGVAAVIGPFNFPIHLAHGAITAYLLAGNPVVFKPSPLAAVVAGQYGKLMQSIFPAGVFELVQGGATEGQQLTTHPLVRAVCFTGSVSAGRSIALATAGDLPKDIALELGGKNAVIVCADADLQLAAVSIADAMCLTAGQRCNSTSRVIVDARVESELIDRLRLCLMNYGPGDPMLDNTRLGPVISAAAKERYIQAIQTHADWIIPGDAPDTVSGKRGHFVQPAVLRIDSPVKAHKSDLFTQEIFAPLLAIVPVTSDMDAINLCNCTPYGLTASVFTRSKLRFHSIANELDVGNVYANLPTTMSPSTLPFGGLRDSGNHHPGGRGFIRFTTNEQVLQIAKETLSDV